MQRLREKRKPLNICSHKKQKLRQFKADENSTDMTHICTSIYNNMLHYPSISPQRNRTKWILCSTDSYRLNSNSKQWCFFMQLSAFLTWMSCYCALSSDPGSCPFCQTSLHKKGKHSYPNNEGRFQNTSQCLLPKLGERASQQNALYDEPREIGGKQSRGDLYALTQNWDTKKEVLAGL